MNLNQVKTLRELIELKESVARYAARSILTPQQAEVVNDLVNEEIFKLLNAINAMAEEEKPAEEKPEEPAAEEPEAGEGAEKAE